MVTADHCPAVSGVKKQKNTLNAEH